MWGQSIHHLHIYGKDACIMKITIFGGTGTIGGRIVTEAIARGHEVTALACVAQYKLCEVEKHVDWTYLCPPAVLVPGERTGSYRTGNDRLVIDADGKSLISMEDLAVALLDEAEWPRHRGQRFTVAY
jgi:putative NADH-flavin reductase